MSDTGLEARTAWAARKKGKAAALAAAARAKRDHAVRVAALQEAHADLARRVKNISDPVRQGAAEAVVHCLAVFIENVENESDHRAQP